MHFLQDDVFLNERQSFLCIDEISSEKGMGERQRPLIDTKYHNSKTKQKNVICTQRSMHEFKLDQQFLFFLSSYFSLCQTATTQISV